MIDVERMKEIYTSKKRNESTRQVELMNGERLIDNQLNCWVEREFAAAAKARERNRRMDTKN